MFLALDELPDPSPLVTVALLGLLVVLWTYARLGILRRQLARGEADQPGVTRIRLLHALAAWRGTNALLVVLALGFGVLLWWALSAS